MYGIIIEEELNEAIIRMEDGGLATIHLGCENFQTEYYQTRTKDEVIDWDQMSESKIYSKNWEGKESIDVEMIKDAVSWLVCCTEKIEFTIFFRGQFIKF